MTGKRINDKMKGVSDRIKRLEEAIAKGTAYLETGKHAKWRGFRPLFTPKKSDDKELPPHKDWVKNVFLKRIKRALTRAEELLEKLT